MISGCQFLGFYKCFHPFNVSINLKRLSIDLLSINNYSNRFDISSSKKEPQERLFYSESV